MDFTPQFCWKNKTASTIQELIDAGAPADLDWVSISVFLRLGAFIGDSTPFLHIKATSPEFRVVSKSCTLPRNAIIDSFIDLFREAIANCEPGIIPLSGGRDSRHILLEFVHQNRKPEYAVSAKHFPPKPNEDSEIASLVCERAGVRHIIVEQGGRFSAQIALNPLTHFCAPEHYWVTAMRPYIAGKTIYDGIAGDILSAATFQTAEHLKLYREGKFDELARELLSVNAVDCIFPGRFSMDAAIDAVVQELKRHMEAVNPLASYYLWNRTRRNVALSFTGASPKKVVNPFLKIFDFLSSLPPEVTLPGTLHTETIQRAYPKYADIPFEQKLGKNPKSSRFYALQVLHYCWKLNPRYLVPRLTASAIFNSDHVEWIAPPAMYMQQLLTYSAVLPTLAALQIIIENM